MNKPLKSIFTACTAALTSGLCATVFAHAGHQSTEPNPLFNLLPAQTQVAQGPPPPATSNAIASADPGVVGAWSEVFDWPVIAIHASLLPNGKVLAWDSVADDYASGWSPDVQDSTRVTLWDPLTNLHTRVDSDTDSNLFCSGHAHLPNGVLLVVGGNVNAGDGITATNLFDAKTNTWARVQNMLYPRWYPSVTPLANGEMLVTSGYPSVHQVWTNSRTYRYLTTAERELPLYPWMHAAPDGDVYLLGPEQELSTLDPTGSGAWFDIGQRDSFYRGYGGHALYDIGKVLIAGGGPSSASALTFSLDDQLVEATGAMQIGRRQHNLTVLADGSALATGGNSSGAVLIDVDSSVLAPEIWDPHTGDWTLMAPMQETRQYHSTALLLPDGRVLSAGGGFCSQCEAVNYRNKNAEIFSPPYLFKKDGSGELATRPVIDAAPLEAEYGSVFVVDSADADFISGVSLVRLSSVTHSVNMTQRFIPLSFTVAGAQLSVSAPADPNDAPPRALHDVFTG